MSDLLDDKVDHVVVTWDTIPRHYEAPPITIKLPPIKVIDNTGDSSDVKDSKDELSLQKIEWMSDKEFKHPIVKQFLEAYLREDVYACDEIVKKLSHTQLFHLQFFLMLDRNKERPKRQKIIGFLKAEEDALFE